MATDDDDAATLRERVRELEQTVAQQQDTIQQLMPSRRAVLAGGAGLVGGAALTGQASAQSAAGQVGTSSEPVDVEAATVSADSVNTEKASINETSTQIFNESTQSVASGTVVQIEFDTVNFSEIGGVDLSNNQIEVQDNGTYLIKAQVGMVFDSITETYDVRLNVNGNRVGFCRNAVNKESLAYRSAWSVEQLTTSDVIDVEVFQQSGNSQDTDEGNEATKLGVMRLG